MASKTIKDIARAANVSYSTVSRALNRKEGVGAATRERIFAIAKEFGYTPNAIAQGLVTQRTKTIGLVLPDVTNPFFPEVAAGVELAADELGLSVFLCNTNWDKDKEERYLRLLAQRRVDGIIVSLIANEPEELVRDAVGDTPVVYVNHAPLRTERPFVAIDEDSGSYMATRHLIDQGYATVGFIGAEAGGITSTPRLHGYRRAIVDAGFEYDQRYVGLPRAGENSGSDIIMRMIGEGSCPRAVFAQNDVTAFSVIQGAQACGIRVPEDLAVIGFDDIPTAGFEAVGLSTIRQPKRELGRLSVELLRRQIESIVREGGASDQILLEPELIIRRTSGAVQQQHSRC